MKQTQVHDVLDIDGVKIKKYGKNFRSLVCAGAWVINDFKYGRDVCACCGRPITRLLKLKNTSHDGSEKQFEEVVTIGTTCGPKVFIESCKSFYDDPEKEWERQYKSWKGYIEYVTLCSRNHDVWTSVDENFTNRIDEILDDGYRTGNFTKTWWILHDRKMKLLKSSKKYKDGIGEIIERNLQYYANVLLQSAKRCGIFNNCKFDEQLKLKVNTTV